MMTRTMRPSEDGRARKLETVPDVLAYFRRCLTQGRREVNFEGEKMTPQEAIDRVKQLYPWLD
jgi:hypothetical protein